MWIHVIGEVSERDNFVIVFVEIRHIGFKLLWLCVNPWMLNIRHTVERKDRDISACCLGECPRKVIKIPIGTGGSCRRNQEGMMQGWVVSRSAVAFSAVRELWSDTAAGKMKAVFSENVDSRFTRGYNPGNRTLSALKYGKSRNERQYVLNPH